MSIQHGDGAIKEQAPAHSHSDNVSGLHNQLHSTGHAELLHHAHHHHNSHHHAAKHLPDMCIVIREQNQKSIDTSLVADEAQNQNMLMAKLALNGCLPPAAISEQNHHVNDQHKR